MAKSAHQDIKEEYVLRLVNGLVLPRKSFDFIPPNGANQQEPITLHEGLDEIVDALLNGRTNKDNPSWVEKMDRWWAREHAAAMFAIELLNGHYEDYLSGRFLMYKRLVDDGIKEVIPNLKGKNVIEVGSGSGISLTMLAREGAIAHGLDISETALGFFRFLAKHYGVRDNTRILRSDFYKTGLPSDNFDLAYNVGVFEHRTKEEQAALIEEMKRITSPQGYVMVSVPNFSSPHYELMRKREEKLFQRLKHYMYPERDFHNVDAYQLLEQAGLKIVKQDYVLIAPSTPLDRKIIKSEDYEFFTQLPNINGGNIDTKEKIKLWDLLEKDATPQQRQRYGWFVYAIGKKA